VFLEDINFNKSCFKDVLHKVPVAMIFIKNFNNLIFLCNIFKCYCYFVSLYGVSSIIYVWSIQSILQNHINTSVISIKYFSEIKITNMIYEFITITLCFVWINIHQQNHASIPFLLVKECPRWKSACNRLCRLCRLWMSSA